MGCDPVYVVPNPNGGPPARTTFVIGAGGTYRIGVIGQPSYRMRVRLDGRELPAARRDGRRGLPLRAARSRATHAGAHSLALVAGGHGEIAYIFALSLARTDPPEAVVVCVAGRRARLAPGRPVSVRKGQRIAACGGRAALLDRIAGMPSPTP